MRRLLARWLISRSIDADRELPHWLRAWATDLETARFEAAARKLAASLADDATAWRAIDPHPARQVRTADNAGWRPIFDRRALAAGVVACLFVTGLALRSRESGPQQQSPATPQEWQFFLATIEEGRLMAKSLDPQPEWKLALQTLEPSMRRLPLPRFQSGTDNAALQAYSAVDKHLRRQRDSLNSQMDAAMSFFTQRLPESTAKVVSSPLRATARMLN